MHTHPPLSKIHLPNLLPTYFPTYKEILCGKSFLCWSWQCFAKRTAKAYTATILPQFICPSSKISSAMFTNVLKAFPSSTFSLFTIPLKTIECRSSNSFTVLLMVLQYLLGGFLLSSTVKLITTSIAITSASRPTVSSGEPETLKEVCVDSSVKWVTSFSPFEPGRIPICFVNSAKIFLLWKFICIFGEPVINCGSPAITKSLFTPQNFPEA